MDLRWNKRWLGNGVPLGLRSYATNQRMAIKSGGASGQAALDSWINVMCIPLGCHTVYWDSQIKLSDIWESWHQTWESAFEGSVCFLGAAWGYVFFVRRCKGWWLNHLRTLVSSHIFTINLCNHTAHTAAELVARPQEDNYHTYIILIFFDLWWLELAMESLSFMYSRWIHHTLPLPRLITKR